eukprot:COSAG06_NODE_36106_length_451_cov_1.778409_1_plen_45_part_01
MEWALARLRGFYASMSISMICTHCEKKQLFPSVAGGDATDQTKLS